MFDFFSSQAGTGSYLNLTFEILDGNYKGRKVWSRLNLDNPNQQAVQIAAGIAGGWSWRAERFVRQHHLATQGIRG